MISTCYIDTCALKWRYLNGSPTSAVNQLMDDPHVTVATSELTILEWSSALGKTYRSREIDYDSFKRNELALMGDIAAGALVIFPITRTIERARYLIEYVGVHHSRHLTTGDSIQLRTALDVSASARQLTTFVTCDKKLSKTIQHIDDFKPHLESVYLSPS